MFSKNVNFHFSVMILLLILLHKLTDLLQRTLDFLNTVRIRNTDITLTVSTARITRNTGNVLFFQ